MTPKSRWRAISILGTTTIVFGDASEARKRAIQLYGPQRVKALIPISPDKQKDKL